MRALRGTRGESTGGAAGGGRACVYDRKMHGLCLTGHTRTHTSAVIHQAHSHGAERPASGEGSEVCTPVALLCHPTPPTPRRQLGYSLEAPPPTAADPLIVPATHTSLQAD